MNTISNWGNVEALGTHHVSTLPRYWIARLYVALSTLTSVLVTWGEPQALTHTLIAKSGPPGWFMLFLLGSLAATAVVDVLINDLLPQGYSLAIAKDNRHFIYILLACGNVSLCYVFVAGLAWWRPLVMPFLLDASFAALVAFLDLFQRHRVRE